MFGLLCVVSWRSPRQTDHSSRGVLPNLVRRCVRSRNLVNEEDLAHWGLLRTPPPQKKTNKPYVSMDDGYFQKISRGLGRNIQSPVA
jgi:hypothetical protein